MKNKKNIITERKTIDIEGMLQDISKIARSNNRLLEPMNKSMKNINLMLEEISNTLDKLGNNISTDFKSLGVNAFISVLTDNDNNASHAQRKHRLSKADSQYLANESSEISLTIPLPTKDILEILTDEFKKGLRDQKLIDLTIRVAKISIALNVRRKTAEYIAKHSSMSDLDMATSLGHKLNFNVATLLQDAIDTKLSNKESLKNTSLKDILLREAYDKKNGIFHKGAKHKASYFSEKDTTGIPHGKPSYSRYLKKYNGNYKSEFHHEYMNMTKGYQLILNYLYYTDKYFKSLRSEVLKLGEIVPGIVSLPFALTNQNNTNPKKSIYPSSLTEGLSLPNINLMKDILPGSLTEGLSLPNITLVGDIISNDINKMKTMMSSLPKISSYLEGYNLPALNAPNSSNNSNIINNNNIEININATGDVNTDALRNTVGTAVIDSIQQGTSFID